MNMARSRSLILTFALALVVTSSASAGTPGALDADFGTDGITTVANIKQHSPGLVGIVPFDSGRTIAAVNRDRSEPPTKNRELLYAIDGRGAAIKSFGVKGALVAANGTALLDVAKSRGGNLLLLESGSRLRALDENGVTVTTFATSGVLDLGLSSRNCSPTRLAVQASGRIILAGSNQGAPCVIGITSGGSVDDAFGDHGVQTFTGSSVPKQLSPGLAARDDDSILVGVFGKPDPAKAGSTIAESGVVKFTGDGELDTTFGDAGLASLPFTVVPTVDESTKGVNEIAPTANGGALLSVAQGRDYQCTRGCSYTAIGYHLDSTGRVSRVLPSLTQVTDFAAAPGGLVVAGQEYYDGTDVSRLTGEGAPDLSFIAKGWNGIELSSFSSKVAVAVDASGNVLLGGTTLLRTKDYPFDDDIFVARFLGTQKGNSAPQIDMIDYAWDGLDASDRVSLRGTAKPAGEIRTLDIAIERRNSKLDKRHVCQWIRGRKGGYVTRKLRKGKCPNPVFMHAKGVAKWKLDIAPGLRLGRHHIYAKPILKEKRALKKSEIWEFSVKPKV